MHLSFTYPAEFWIDEEDFNEMLNKIESGQEVKKVVEEWMNSLNKDDYYASLYIKVNLMETLRMMETMIRKRLTNNQPCVIW